MKKVVLECINVSKKIKNKTILNNINLKLYEQDILGFIGPNGAGKTTTMKVILSLCNYKEGYISICGYDIKNDYEKAISKVGAMIENPDLYTYLTGYQNLYLAAKIYNINKERIEEVIKLLGLDRRIHDKVSKYSLGMKQRLGLAISILHKPKLLILDEPTNGLDPEAIKKLRYILKRISKQENMSILISSHNLSELETICNKACIIKNGTILSYYNLNNNKYTNNYIIEVSHTNINNIINDYKKIDKHHIKVKTNKKNIPKIINKLVKNNISIYKIIEEQNSLEDIYLKITRGNTID